MEAIKFFDGVSFTNLGDSVKDACTYITYMGVEGCKAVQSNLQVPAMGLRNLSNIKGISLAGRSGVGKSTTCGRIKAILDKYGLTYPECCFKVTKRGDVQTSDRIKDSLDNNTCPEYDVILAEAPFPSGYTKGKEFPCKLFIVVGQQSAGVRDNTLNYLCVPTREDSRERLESRYQSRKYKEATFQEYMETKFAVTDSKFGKKQWYNISTADFVGGTELLEKMLQDIDAICHEISLNK